MITEIRFLENNIIVKEERKKFFKNKQYTENINIELIDKIERIISNNKMIGFLLWHKEEVLYGVGEKNYKDDIEKLYNDFLLNVKSDSINIVDIEL